MATPQDHGPAPDAVGQCAVKQIHDRKAEQVGRQRLLHLHRRGADGLRNAGEGRQVGVDGKRPQHAQARQQDSKGPARCAPDLEGVGIHRSRPSLAVRANALVRWLDGSMTRWRVGALACWRAGLRVRRSKAPLRSTRRKVHRRDRP
jgi:hypothetical protein